MTDHQHDDDRVSIPDVLAHAIVLPDAPESKPATADRGALPEGDSPVDTWAFPELASVPPPARDNSVVDEWAHGEEEDEATAAWRKSMPSLTDDVDAEEPSLATLRPSAVTLRPVAMQRRTSRGLLVAGLGIAAAAAVVGIATTRTPTAPTSAVAAPGLDVAVPELPQGITVRANPAGATFALDGASRGPGPLTADDLAVGRHHLLVQAEGFLPLERDVLVTRGKVEDLGVLSLEPASVALILDVSPSNAFVVVGGADGNLDGKRYSGPWPREIAIPPGTYNIVAFGQGLSTSQQQVTLAPGREAAAVQFRLASSDIYE